MCYFINKSLPLLDLYSDTNLKTFPRGSVLLFLFFPPLLRIPQNTEEEEGSSSELFQTFRAAPPFDYPPYLAPVF